VPTANLVFGLGYPSAGAIRFLAHHRHKGHHFADVDWDEKIHVVDGGGHDGAGAVAHDGARGGSLNPSLFDLRPVSYSSRIVAWSLTPSPMSQDRIDSLKAMLAQDANNSFVRYALAQALANGGNLAAAAQGYQDLIALDPLYVAAYFHGGQTYEKLGEVEKARAIYEQGIEACQRKGDSHTGSEIQGALDLLP